MSKSAKSNLDIKLKSFFRKYIKDKTIEKYEIEDEEKGHVIIHLSNETKLHFFIPKRSNGEYIYYEENEEKQSIEVDSLETALGIILSAYENQNLSDDTITENTDDYTPIDTPIEEDIFLDETPTGGVFDFSVITDPLGISPERVEKYEKEMMEDIEKARNIVGKNNIGVYKRPTNTYFVRFALNTFSLNKWSAEALCVDRSRKIIIELEWDWNYLDASKPPSLSKNGIFQSSNEDLNVNEITDVIRDFGVLRWYLSNRLGTALRKNWVRKKEFMEDSKYYIPPPKKEENPFIDQIVSIGFTRKQAIYALKQTQNDVNAAANLLMDTEIASQFESMPDPEMDLFDNGPQFNKNLDFEPFENFFAEGNVFVGILKYMNYKFENCSSNCVICDQKLGFEGMKPTVCDNELCIHSLEEYGIGIDVVGALLHNSDVVDILISLTYSAAQMHINTNGVRELNPFPSSIEVDGLHFRGTNGKDVNLIINVLDKMPSVDEMARASKGDQKILKEYLDGKHKLAFPLLRWILASNRAHISPVPRALRISQLPKEVEQYIMVSGNPEKERVFRQNRREIRNKTGKRGSFYAFHGSAVGNWHCILRIGLKNYSNTKMMSTGAAYGPGIYFGLTMATSAGYMRNTTKCWPNGKRGNFLAMALCEILDHRDDGKGITTFNWGYTVQEESYVTTRYFLIMKNNMYGCNIKAEDLKLPEDLYN